ncbi:unnamed protein product [Camellia sinensis]
MRCGSVYQWRVECVCVNGVDVCMSGEIGGSVCVPECACICICHVCRDPAREIKFRERREKKKKKNPTVPVPTDPPSPNAAMPAEPCYTPVFPAAALTAPAKVLSDTCAAAAACSLRPDLAPLAPPHPRQPAALRCRLRHRRLCRSLPRPGSP